MSHCPHTTAAATIALAAAASHPHTTFTLTATASVATASDASSTVAVAVAAVTRFVPPPPRASRFEAGERPAFVRTTPNRYALFCGR